MSISVELVSPERIAWSGQAKGVIARTTDGDAAFLDGHIPMIAVLQGAPVRILLEDDTEVLVAVHRGFIEVAPADGSSKITILSDVCEIASEIDADRAAEAQRRAQEALVRDEADLLAGSALHRAQTRLTVAAAA